MYTQYVTNDKGEPSVVITMKDFKKLVEAYEDLEDLKAYDKAKARKNEKYFSLESVKQELRTLGKLD
jgi:hypothetical protein